MITTSSIINKIVSSLNCDADFVEAGTAVRAFELTTLPVPLKQAYFSLSASKNAVSFSTNSSGTVTEEQSVSIKMTCYTPLTRPAYTTNDLAESVLEYMAEIFGEALTGYTLGETDYDSDVNAYKVICYLNFSYTTTDSQ